MVSGANFAVTSSPKFPLTAFGGSQSIASFPRDSVTFSGKASLESSTPDLGPFQLNGIPPRGILQLIKTAPSIVKGIGGYPLDKERLKERREFWQGEIEQKLSGISTTRHFGVDIPRVASSLAGFGIEEWTGLPPSVRWKEKEKQPANCNGAVASVVLHLLGELPPAQNAEEAVVQLEELLFQVSEGAVKQGKRVAGEKVKREKETADNPRTDLTCGKMIGKGGFSIASVRNSAWSTLQTRHMTLIAPNGAVQVLLMPNFQQLADILRHDETARKALDEKPLLNLRDWGFYPWKGTLNSEETLQLLDDQADGTMTHRIHESSDWTDTHTLIRDLPIDLKKHLDEGRLKVIFEKPGADGKQVWDVLA